MNNQERRPSRGNGPMGLGGGPMGMGGGAKAKDFKGTLKTLIAYLTQYKTSIIVVMIFSVASTIFSIIGPKILGNATQEIFEGVVRKLSGGPGIDFDAVGDILLLLVGLYVLSALFSYIQGYVMAGVTQKVTYNLRKELIGKIGKMPMKSFDTLTHGEVLSRITNDIDTLSQGLNQSITQIITSVCTLVGILIMMLSISWQMTIVAILMLPLSLGVVIPVVKKSQKYFVQQQEHLGHVNGQVEEVYSGHNIVKVFNREEEVKQEFAKENQQLYQSGWKSQFLSGLMMPAMTFVSNLGYVAVSILGGYLAIQGTITVGNIQSFIQYTKNFTQPITQIAQISSMLQATVAAAERVFEFLAEPEEEQAVENPVSTRNIHGNVSFENVRFGYDPDKIIIHDFNASIKDGQKIAIVGPTGAGKTTMVKLLMRFYDVNEGAIKLDGTDIRKFDRGELRKEFGMVLQDTWLFNGTIMENIRYGRLDATDEEVIAAAKTAHVHHFIQTLPEGYNMVLNEEASNVSEGQKQLLTIARAILANPEILILDEATSSVDTLTEIRIQKAMGQLMKGRTSFIIAHRLSTIKDADLILVMNNGDIVEQGSHNKLIAANGFYTNLYNSQFQRATA
ncbi:MAG: ABC transporter ATP-binding protein [Anaerolineaceae bacterium]